MKVVRILLYVLFAVGFITGCGGSDPQTVVEVTDPIIVGGGTGTVGQVANIALIPAAPTTGTTTTLTVNDIRDITAIVTDSDGNLVSGATVNIIGDGGGTFTTTSAVTDATGRVVYSLQAPTLIGTEGAFIEATGSGGASSGGWISTQWDFQYENGVATRLGATGIPAQLSPAGSTSIILTAYDQFNNLVSNVSIAATATHNSGVVGDEGTFSTGSNSANKATGSSGQATFAYSAGKTGTVTLNFNSPIITGSTSQAIIINSSAPSTQDLTAQGCPRL